MRLKENLCCWYYAGNQCSYYVVYRTCVCVCVYTHCPVLCLVTQLCPTLCNPMDCSPPAPLSVGILQARILEWVAMPSSRDLLNPGIESRFPEFQVDSLPSEPPGKPKNTRVGSLSLLQGIFPTQESNQGLLHGRKILYQLSYQGSPYTHYIVYLHINIY